MRIKNQLKKNLKERRKKRNELFYQVIYIFDNLTPKHNLNPIEYDLNYLKILK